MNKVRRCTFYSVRLALNAACVCSLLESVGRFQRGEPFLSRTPAEDAVWLVVFALAFGITFLLEMRSA